MNVVGMALTARRALRDETARVLKAQKEFEGTISHLTPQRQAELMAIRQIALESARRRRYSR